MMTDCRPAICVLMEEFYPVMNGAATQFLLLSDRLMTAGVRVLVLTRKIETGHASRERVQGIDVLRVKPAVGLRRSGKFLMLLPALWALYRERRSYDIILVSDLKVLGILGVLAAMLLGKRCLLRVETCGELDLAGWELSPGATPGLLSALVARLARLRNRLLIRADGFISISSAVTEEMLGAGVPDAKIARIPNGIDAGRFSPAPPEEQTALRRQLGLPDGKLFIYTGRLARGKGLEVLLEAWKDLSRVYPEARLALVGSGQGYPHDIEAELRAFIATHGLADSTVFTGNVDNVHDYLRAGDFFVFPSEAESFGLSLVEALACGLPSIATGVGGMLDYMDHGRNGLLVPLGDQKQLHETMSDLLGDAAKARCLGLESRKMVLKRFDIDLIAKEYLALFRQVMNGSAEGRKLISH